LFGRAEVTAGIALGIAVARFRHGRRDAIAPLFIALTVIIETALKLLVPHPAPPSERAHTIDLLPFLHVNFVNSFPSGHLARVTFLLGIVDGISPWVALAGVALMLLSRVYLGEHWLTDCLGGAALGALVAQLGRRVGRSVPR
jgi:membrane-associated phospholipid phosphatase